MDDGANFVIRHSSFVIRSFVIQTCPRRESNPDRAFRKRLLYPLSYEDCWAELLRRVTSLRDASFAASKLFVFVPEGLHLVHGDCKRRPWPRLAVEAEQQIA